ncbi:hypothetical protein ACHAXT_005816 [Thalassiosira profunda]
MTGLWSRGLALLLLASAATQPTLAAPRPHEGAPRRFRDALADVPAATTRRLGKATKQPGQHRHHGGGGKHDTGPGGHHPVKAAAAAEAKSGKAAAGAVADGWETAATEAAPIATEAADGGWVEVDADAIVVASGKAGKSTYVETDSAKETEAAVAGPHAAKSGKDPVAMYEGPHGAAHDIVSEAKSGKAGGTGGTGSTTAMSVPPDAKSGKGPAAPMSYAAKGSSFKPKADKLSPYFIKEVSADAKSGKSAGGKAGKVMSVDAGEKGEGEGSDGWSSSGGGSKTSKDPTTVAPTEIPATATATAVAPVEPETTVPAAATTAAPDDVLPDQTPLLTLSPTPAPIANETLALNETVQLVAPAPRSEPLSSEDSEPTSYPTYMPTKYDQDPLNAQGGDNTRVLEPFGVRLSASKSQPRYDEAAVQAVTRGHLIHSFRAKDWEAEGLDLMVLAEEDQRRLEAGPIARLLSGRPEFELVFGGVLHFPPMADVPTAEQTKQIVAASFQGERLEYYVELLREAGLDIEAARLDMDLVPLEAVAGGSDGGNDGFNWAGLAIGLSAGVVGIVLLALAGRACLRRRVKTLDELDLEKGNVNLSLQYTNDELETVPSSEDHLSIPSLVKGRGEETVSFMPTPGSKATLTDELGSISPLESPNAHPATTPTRYISVFTVKKDCGGRSLAQVDLRALAVAYLSRMLRKFPRTHLLPYDKTAPLPAITNVRDIPDDLDELREYVGNARIDPRTGKVLFNLRVESDEPVSKMKSGSGGGSRSNKYKSKAGPGRVTSVKSSDEMEKDEMPSSPGTFTDVKL